MDLGFLLLFFCEKTGKGLDLLFFPGTFDLKNSTIKYYQRLKLAMKG